MHNHKKKIQWMKLKMTAEECAKYIAVAIRNRKRTLIANNFGQRTLFISKFFSIIR